VGGPAEKPVGPFKILRGNFLTIASMAGRTAITKKQIYSKTEGRTIKRTAVLHPGLARGALKKGAQGVKSRDAGIDAPLDQLVG